MSALFAALVLVATAIVSPQAIGADDDKVYLVTYAKFKPGKAPLALQIIRELFQPVDKKIGRRVLRFDYVTEDWDHIVIFRSTLRAWTRFLLARNG